MSFWSDIGNGIQKGLSWLGNTAATFLDPITHNKENFELQKSELEYQHQLQETVFNREDTAQQRAADDLASAGLSKTLAAGSGAGVGPVISTNAPKRDNDLDVFMNMASLATQMANISHTQAETNRLNHDLQFAKDNNLPMAALGTDGFLAWQAANNLLGDVYTDTPVGNVVTDAAARILEVAKNAAEYMNPERNLDVGKIPQPTDFVSYSDYNHQTKLAGYTPASEAVFNMVKRENKKGFVTYHVSSDGAAHGGRSGSF